jgi:hypothetical protein
LDALIIKKHAVPLLDSVLHGLPLALGRLWNLGYLARATEVFARKVERERKYPQLLEIACY